MKVSFHHRRHESLPPQPARSPRLLLVAIILGIGTTALAAAGLSGRDAPESDPAISAAEQASRDVVDERVRAHLRSLR